MDQATLRVLLKNGLNEKQARIYLCLLDLGQATVSQAADAAGLKRPLVYLLLSELKERGLVMELTGRAVKRFITVDPRLFLKQRQDALADLEFMMPALVRKHEHEIAPRPRVTVVEGAAGILRMYRQFGRAMKARYISSYAALRAAFPDEVQQWIRSAQIDKSTTPRYQILADDPEGRAFAEAVRHCRAWNIRLLPTQVKIQTNFDIVENVVMITHFDPLFATIIHSEKLADDYAAMFDLLWQSCCTYKKRKASTNTR